MKNLLQNRIVVGLICIVTALVICFGLTPMFNDALKSKVEIVRVSTEIKKGDEITPKMLTTVEVGGYDLPSNVVYQAEDVIGKYANTDLYKGDYVLPYTAELEQQDNERTLFQPLTAQESIPYSMEISRIAADTFAVPMAAAAKGKGTKQGKAAPQTAPAQTAKPGKGKNGFKLPFARNKGEF